MNPYKPNVLSGNRIQFACGCIEKTHPDNLKGGENEVRENLATLADCHQVECFEFKEIAHKYLASLASADDDDPDKTDFES